MVEPVFGASTNEKVPVAPVAESVLIVMEPLPRDTAAFQLAPVDPMASSAFAPAGPPMANVPGPVATVANPSVCVAPSVPEIVMMLPFHAAMSAVDAAQFVPSILALSEPCGRLVPGPIPPSSPPAQAVAAISNTARMPFRKRMCSTSFDSSLAAGPRPAMHCAKRWLMAVIRPPIRARKRGGAAAIRTGLLAALVLTGCRMPEPAPLPPDSFAFAVFGDGPYGRLETRRFDRLLRDVAASDVEWLLHVGDILWYPCSDPAYADRLRRLNSLPLPVVYTPGDNEWVDCHEPITGEFVPLERLARLRAVFFDVPGRSIGGRPMPLETQAADPRFAEFVENTRWRRGGFLFVTLHMTGSGNALGGFEGRTAADDAEVERRTAAALAWMEAAFATTVDDGLTGVVLAMHGNPGLEREPAAWRGYEAFVAALEHHVRDFDGPVLLIHGDTHTLRIDQPLVDHTTGELLDRFTRLETYGSPDIGWVRVTIDTVAGRIVGYDARRVPGWWPW